MHFNTNVLAFCRLDERWLMVRVEWFQTGSAVIENNEVVFEEDVTRKGLVFCDANFLR